MTHICVFMGSNIGVLDEYAAAARTLARQLVSRQCTLVYGGAKVGLMGVLADEVLRGGGQAIGVIPEHLRTKELAHEELSELHVVDSMHERKAMMAKLSDGVIALPGGLGTLEELFEMITWAQLGLHGKPCGLLNVAGYYDQLLAFLDHAVGEKFVMPAHRAMLLAESDPARLLLQMEHYISPVYGSGMMRTTS